jgi:hypothetical protein
MSRVVWPATELQQALRCQDRFLTDGQNFFQIPLRRFEVSLFCFAGVLVLRERRLHFRIGRFAFNGFLESISFRARLTKSATAASTATVTTAAASSISTAATSPAASEAAHAISEYSPLSVHDLLDQWLQRGPFIVFNFEFLFDAVHSALLKFLHARRVEAASAAASILLGLGPSLVAAERSNAGYARDCQHLRHSFHK